MTTDSILSFFLQLGRRVFTVTTYLPTYILPIYVCMYVCKGVSVCVCVCVCPLPIYLPTYPPTNQTQDVRFSTYSDILLLLLLLKLYMT